MDRYIKSVDKHRQLILDALDYIWKNPEPGYREWKTQKYLAEAYEKLGYQLTMAGDIPGFTALVDTGRPGPTVMVFGEMDSLIIPSHPDADPETGAVHACGHCAQSAALLGLAAALKEPGILDELSGKILLVAVPAEELIEMEFRTQLQKQGTIRCMGGKPEFLHRGLLDGADLAFMVHTGRTGPHSCTCNGGTNGFVVKNIMFEGVASHAGGSPHRGVNALYAANLALNAINALRETFQDNAHIRVHPVITAGGDSVNTIPADVRLESYVRGADMASIVEANNKVNRAVAAAAAAMGAKVRIQDMPGYCPRYNDRQLMKTFEEAMAPVITDIDFNTAAWGAGSSDMGDICALMPSIHPTIGGASGKPHGVDYRISDPETACVDSAKIQLLAIKLLLQDGAARAKKIVADYKPTFASKEEYFAYMDGLAKDRQAVSYDEKGNITLNLGN